MKPVKRYVAVLNCEDAERTIASIRGSIRRLGGLLLEANVSLSAVREYKEQKTCVFRILALSSWAVEAAILAAALTRNEEGVFLSPVLLSGTVRALEEKLFGTVFSSERGG